MKTESHRRAVRRLPRTALLGAALFAAGCTHLNVASDAVDSEALKGLRTFAVLAPPPAASVAAAASFNGSDRGSAVAMDMDPMLSTSLVGRAIRQDLQQQFDRRGYRVAESSPDFYVAYYAGTGEEVDIRAHQYKYHAEGERVDVRTTKYPAGTLIVDVVSAKTNSLVWRGTAIAEIPKDPNNYASTIHTMVGKIVARFPRA